MQNSIYLDSVGRSGSAAFDGLQGHRQTPSLSRTPPALAATVAASPTAAPMKILRLIGGLDPAHGGPPRSAVNSIIAAQRAGAETTLAFPIEQARTPSVEEAVARLEGEGVRVVAFNPTSMTSLRARSWGLNGAMAAWSLHEARRYDIVHCHGAWQMATLLATLARRQGQPLVLTPHESLTGFDIAHASSGTLRLLKTMLRRRYLGRFDLMATASRLEADDSVPAGYDRLAVLPHAVYDETLCQPLPQSPARPGRALRLGFLGRLHAKKNLDIAIRALPRLPEGVSLTVAGDGPQRAAWMSLADELGVAGRVRWLGFVEGEAKADFFRSIDLLVMPSDYEGFGMAAAEAMTRGVPVVVSPLTGIAELIRAEGGGEIVRADLVDYIRTIGDLAARPDRRAALSREAMAAAAKQLSFAAHGAALISHYRRLLGAATG